MKKFIKFIIVVFYIFIVFIVWWLGFLRYGGNFHKVAEDVYRSAQLYDYNLPKFYEKYKFKTILNLRGAKPGREWYEYEKRFATEHNITLINFKISDKKIQSIQTMDKIINYIKNAKKPILIHCKAGADRTGLVSALYLYSLGDENASKMLSIKYGHIPIGPTKAMDESFRRYQAIKKH